MWPHQLVGQLVGLTPYMLGFLMGGVLAVNPPLTDELHEWSQGRNGGLGGSHPPASMLVVWEQQQESPSEGSLPKI